MRLLRHPRACSIAFNARKAGRVENNVVIGKMHTFPTVESLVVQAIERCDIDAVFQKSAPDLIFLHLKNIEANLLILLLKV